MKSRRICELCSHEAYLYCASDSAFLCWKCDAKVHDANFLVARHIREVLCCDCRCFAGSKISGSVAPFKTVACQSCSPEHPSDEDDCLSSSSSSACISSTESSTTGPKKIHRRTETVMSSGSVTDEKCAAAVGGKKDSSGRFAAEEVFGNWSRKLGVNANCVALSASPAMEKFMALIPFRVAVATAFWFGLRYRGDGQLRTAQNLRKLEEMSKVPGRVIVAAEEKLTRVLRPKRARREFEEGWAEC